MEVADLLRDIRADTGDLCLFMACQDDVWVFLTNFRVTDWFARRRRTIDTERKIYILSKLALRKEGDECTRKFHVII